jgi:hypothetical protein
VTKDRDRRMSLRLPLLPRWAELGLQMELAAEHQCT